MDKLASLWAYIRKNRFFNKYLVTLVIFAVVLGFLDENNLMRRLGYAREESRLRDEIENIGMNTRRIPNGLMNWLSIRELSNVLLARSI